MKTSDIPMFTKESDYEVTVGLGHLESILKDYIDDYKLELNPDFQRGHVWTESQQIAYIEFLLRGGKTAKVIYFNCPYFRDYEPEKYDMDMVCVDGLQRLTAIRKFLNNEIRAFGYLLNEFEDADVLKRKYSIRININDLKTRKEVLQWYLDFNIGGTIHIDEEIERVRNLLAECK